MSTEKGLKRALNLRSATVLNMIDMVGIGPFTVLPVILLALPGKFSLLPWLVGAVVSLADGMIWSELGAAWPEAGGSFVFLQKLYRGRLGKILAFLYSMQTSIHLPLVLTSASLGLVNYLRYVLPLGFWQGKAVMVGIVVLVVALLYRKISTIGKIGFVLSVVMILMLLWTIVTGVVSFDAKTWTSNSIMPAQLLHWNNIVFWTFIGSYTSKTVYAYLGYYNVCHIGGEIKNPAKNIPRSILISIVCIAVLYIAMQGVVAGAVPQSEITSENIPLLSILFEHVYGKGIAFVVTGVLLVVACSSLFALMLGYSRIIYAAACQGMHFKIFAHVHPTKHFPDYVLLVFGGIAVIFCLLFDQPSSVFRFIVVTRILIQFVPQAVGVILMRVQKRTNELPFQMPFFPFVAILSIVIWLFLFVTSGLQYLGAGIAIIAVGLLLYFLFFNNKKVGPLEK